MILLYHIFLIVLAGASVAIADVLIKKAAFNVHNLIDVLKSPLMIPIMLLYLLQVILFAYVFVRKWELGIVGLLQMALYAIIVVVSGIYFFHEKITLTHGIGMVAALIGVFLMNM